MQVQGEHMCVALADSLTAGLDQSSWNAFSVRVDPSKDRVQGIFGHLKAAVETGPKKLPSQSAKKMVMVSPES